MPGADMAYEADTALSGAPDERLMQCAKGNIRSSYQMFHVVRSEVGLWEPLRVWIHAPSE